MSCRLFLGVAFAFACSPGHADDPGVISCGHARFTVITPNLIRMEYAPKGVFVDAPSWFAVNRSARDGEAKIDANDSSVEIDTGAIHLTYHDDGKPFSPDNLHATIKNRDGTVTWTPGLPSKGNLGGTIRTVDGLNGPVPLGEGVVSRDGWYLLDDSHSDLFVGDWIQSRRDPSALDWYLFGYGHDYRAALRSLTKVGGPIPLPRKYVLGIWYSRYWPWSEADYRRIVGEYEEHHFPIDVLVLDMDWHLNAKPPGLSVPIDTWTGYTWDKALIPDPPGLLKWLHDQGLHVTLNDHPSAGAQPHEEMYADFMRAMGRDPSSLQTIPFDAGNKNYLDTFYRYTHEPREKEGIDFWWLDWQQYPNTLSIPDLTNLAALNFYNYTRTSANGMRGESFSRWAGWGDHRYPIEFSGDASTGWNMLAFEVPFTSTAGNMGAFFWSHDIGGHRAGRNEESYARWCQFGAFTAALRSHSTRAADMDRRPWTYPDWAEESMRRSFQLRSKMMPYLYTSIAQGVRDSAPYIRPLYFDYPEREEAYHNGQEYFFGDNLIVAPIAKPGSGPDRVASQGVWFPEDDWYDFFTGEKFTGPDHAVISAPINEFPLFVRGGVPLPMQPYTNRPGTAPLTQLVLRCYPGRDGKTGASSVYEDDGVTTGYRNGESATTPLTYVRHGGTVTITVGPTRGSFAHQPGQRRVTIELPCTAMLTSCSVASAKTSYDGTTHTNQIDLPAASIRDGITVNVRGVAGEIATSPSTPPIGILEMNQHPYFLDNDVALIFFHNHHHDPEKATLSLDGGASQPVTLQPGNPIPMPSNFNLAKAGAYGLTETVPFKVMIPDGQNTCSLPGKVTLALDPARDLALRAKATASSGNAQPAIDGFVEGYPHDQGREWVTEHEKAGAWLNLAWDQPVQATTLYLYDRPNLGDQVLAGTIEFDDGSMIDAASLSDDASAPLKITFPRKSISWLKFTVTKVSDSTQNSGLSEIGVFDEPAPK